MTESVHEKALSIIRSNRYMTLATSANGETWAAPLAYVLDDRFRFIWYSATAARHSQHIKSNPNSAIAIFDSTLCSNDADGVQISGIAGEISEGELPEIMELYFKASFPDPEERAKWERPVSDFTGSAPQRFYCFQPVHSWKLDTENTSVDQRVEFQLADG